MSLALLLATELSVDVGVGHTVFGISAPGEYVACVERLGVEHVPIPALTRSWSTPADARAFTQLVRTLRRLHLDVLHTHTPKAGVMGRIAGRLAGVPVVVNTCHGLWARPDDRLLKRTFVYGLEGLATLFSDFELFQNAEDARTMRRFLKPGRWQVVGNGIDLDRFVPDPDGRARVRADWGVRDDQLVVGTIGRRVREKGLAEFAQAAHALGDRAAFVWVGPEDDTDAATTVPHQDAIQFVGERTDMPAVYSALDVFVLASYREGFSRASMEAAACGKALVLSDIRGCREIGKDGEHLLLVPARDGQALARTIVRLLDEPELRAALGDAVQKRAHNRFDQRQIARASLAAYTTVLSARSVAKPALGVGRSVVLHVLPQDLNRGAQVYAGQLRDALRDDAEQEHLVVTLFGGPPGGAHPDLALDAPRTPTRRALSPTALSRLYRLIRQRRPALVVAHGGEALKYVIPAAGRTPTIYYKVGLSAREVNRPARKALYGALARRASRVVGVSSAITDQVADLFGVGRESLSVIPNGRDPEIFHPASPDKPPRRRPLVLWVGQLEPGKRPGLFLDVVAFLGGRGVEFDAAIVGDGPLRASLAGRAEALDVRLLGTRTDVADLLREADVLVFTSASDTEGMPGVLVEAGLSALPVVSTPAAGVADVVVHERTGFVVNDVHQIADRVAALLADAGRRRRLGVAALERCRDSFTVGSTAAAWRTLTQQLIEGDLMARPPQEVSSSR